MNEIFETTTINASARIQKNDDGTYFYEVVLGFLPIGDFMRFDSVKFVSAKDATADLFFSFGKVVNKLMNEYEP